MKKGIVIIFVLLLCLNINIVYADDIDFFLFGNYQTSDQTAGLRIGVGSGYNFNAINEFIT